MWFCDVNGGGNKRNTQIYNQFCIKKKKKLRDAIDCEKWGACNHHTNVIEMTISIAHGTRKKTPNV